MIAKATDSDLSEQQVVDCSSAYFGNYGCLGGWRDYAMMYIQTYGLVTESAYPYTGSLDNCKINHPDETGFKIDQWSIYYGCDYFKTAVRRGPISVGVAASSWAAYESGVFECNAEQDTTINHSVILVGYT